MNYKNSNTTQMSVNKTSDDILASMKSKLLAGSRVLTVDYPPQQRHDAIGAIAALRDELPIVTGWQTLRQSYLSEALTSTRCYRTPEALFQEDQV